LKLIKICKSSSEYKSKNCRTSSLGHAKLFDCLIDAG
jgi:hypothetical protein